MTMLKFRAGLAIAGGLAVSAFMVLIGLPVAFMLGLFGAVLGLLHINFLSDLVTGILDKIAEFTNSLATRLEKLSAELEQAKAQ